MNIKDFKEGYVIIDKFAYKFNSSKDLAYDILHYDDELPEVYITEKFNPIPNARDVIEGLIEEDYYHYDDQEELCKSDVSDEDIEKLQKILDKIFTGGYFAWYEHRGEITFTKEQLKELTGE